MVEKSQEVVKEFKRSGAFDEFREDLGHQAMLLKFPEIHRLKFAVDQAIQQELLKSSGEPKRVLVQNIRNRVLASAFQAEVRQLLEDSLTESGIMSKIADKIDALLQHMYE